MTRVNNKRQFLQMTDRLFTNEIPACRRGRSHSLRSFDMTSKTGSFGFEMAALRAAISNPTLIHSSLSPRPEMLSGAKHRRERSPYMRYILCQQANRRKSWEFKMTRLTRVMMEEKVGYVVAICPLQIANLLLLIVLLSVYFSHHS
jgi:hypothetical protein